MTLRPAARPGVRSLLRTGVAAAAVAAAATATLAGCASQKVDVQNETVSTAGAAAASAMSDVQDGTCPDTPPTSLASDAAGLGGQLEPLAATKALLCVYPPKFQSAGESSASGDSGESASASPPAPTAVKLTDAAVVSSLRNGLNALTAPPTAPVNCPNDTGAVVLGIFTDGQSVTEVLMTTTGCPEASNGVKTGWVGSSDFIGILTGLVKG
jgi:hypothetical protein